MRAIIPLSAVFVLLLMSFSAGCDSTSLDDAAQLPAPDGIDPTNPSIERTTKTVDFSGVRNIRLELPTARVDISESGAGQNASIKITEIVVREGLSHEVLRDLLEGSGVTAERSFIDASRLDVEATIADGLADEDIVFDVRIVVPKGVNLEILVGNGPVSVTGLQGDVEIKTQNGEIEIDDIAGNLAAKTTNRPISVTDVTGDVAAKTTDGSITLRLTPGATNDISVENTSGDIALTIDRSATASLRLTSVEGSVSANLSGFQVTEIATGEGLLRGILNGGGGAIVAKSVSGEIEFVGK